MSHKDWECIYRSTDLLQVKLAEDVLKQHGIESHILNKPDSAIPALGEAELYARKEKAEKARRILKEKGFE